MRIDFFAEFPEEGELQKAELIEFPSTIHIAADSLDEYREYKQKLNQINPDVEPAYWPVVDSSYWVSPFSNTEDLQKVFDEIEGLDDRVLVDLEVPLLNKKLFFKNLPSFRKNKRLIREFLGENQKLMTAEFPGFRGLNLLMNLVGISFSSRSYKHERCPMYYTSMTKSFTKPLYKRSIASKARKGEINTVGLGTIATGVLGDEPILEPEKLEGDLSFLKEIGVENAVIFRLGGLDQDYLEVVHKFTDK